MWTWSSSAANGSIGEASARKSVDQAAEEGRELAAVPGPRVATTEGQPAAQVDRRGQEQRQIEPRVERPGAEEGVRRAGLMAASRASGGASAERAGGWPAGRRLTRNSTSAVISAGLTCLP